MNKRFAPILHWASWAVFSVAVIFGVTRAGYPLWAAFAFEYLLFVFVNASLAYRSVVRQRKLEGQEAPPYLRFLLAFLRSGIPKASDEAPRSAHVMVGVAAALTGLFFMFCGVALAFDAEWSRISHPLIAVTVCLVLAGVGGVFIFLARRLFSFRPAPAKTS